MNDQVALFFDAIWPILGLLVFVVLWTWFLTKDDRKARHPPPAE